MNTKITYMYRDASNYKFFGFIVVSGECKLDYLYDFLLNGEFFIPHEVGIDHLLNMPMNEDDHYLHSFLEFSPTNDGTPTCSAEEFVSRFRIANNIGWFSSMWQ